MKKLNKNLIFILFIVFGLAGPIITLAAGPIFIDTNLNGILDPGELSTTTIQAAITAASPGNTIQVMAGTYTGAVNDTKGVILQGSGVANIVGQVTLNAGGSKIYGFNVTNPSGNFGILINGFGNTEASNNTVHHVGTGAVTGTNYGIWFQDKDLVNADNIKIQNNAVSNIGTITNGSNGGIGVGDSTGNSNITGVVISGNTVSNVTANTANKGAYGIIVSHAIQNIVSNMGSTLGAQITGNTISNLNGRWAHGIGLEGSTPNAIVTGNTIHHLTSTSIPSNAVAVTFEANTGAASVTLHNNSFDTTTVSLGVTNVVSSVTVDATNNYWATSTPAGVIFGSVNYSPWYANAAMTTIGATTTIDTDGNKASVLPIEIATTTSTSAGSVSVVIPAGATVTGPPGWDGTIASPAATSTFTLTPDAGNLALAVSAVEVGAGDMPLVFNQPSKIVFAGLAGKLTGWSRSGVFHGITTTCDSATVPTLAPGTECKIDVGADLVIWTKHFTTFIVYTQTTDLTPATLHVIKLVINSNGGASIPSDFSVTVKLLGANVLGSPAFGTSTPGTLYSLTAGTYLISENTNTSYTESFSGDCNSSGSVTLLPGEDKVCTIVSTNIPIPTATSPGLPSTGGGGNFAPLPLINITKIPSPLALPAGSGQVTYTYTLTNIGPVAMGSVWVKDDQCDSVKFISGDNNNDSMLDLDEVWVYSCTRTVSQTVTNTATTHGSANGWDAYAIAIATVGVGTPVPPPLINISKTPSQSSPFPPGGGDITYTYVVTNPGLISMHNVVVTDDKCAPVSGPSGDINNNNLLDLDEAWTYTCQTNIKISTRNIATAKGSANGFIALGYALNNVLVSVPGLPNTGSQGQSIRIIAINLGNGSRGNNVLTLQQFLISQKKGKAAAALAKIGATSFFGNLTRAALAEFQAKVGISPALGNFGPITRGYLNLH